MFAPRSGAAAAGSWRRSVPLSTGAPQTKHATSSDCRLSSSTFVKSRPKPLTAASLYFRRIIYAKCTAAGMQTEKSKKSEKKRLFCFAAASRRWSNTAPTEPFIAHDRIRRQQRKKLPGPFLAAEKGPGTFFPARQGLGLFLTKSNLPRAAQAP